MIVASRSDDNSIVGEGPSEPTHSTVATGRTSGPRGGLSDAVNELMENYAKITAKDQEYARTEKAVLDAFESAMQEGHIGEASQQFSNFLYRARRAIAEKKLQSDMSWLGRLGDFMNNLWPFARLALCVGAAVGDVHPFCMVD